MQEATWLLWAKTARGEALAAAAPSWHPLVCHMVDVASVARLLLEERLPRRLVDRLVEPIGLPREDAIRWLTALAALHDLGKASPGFQAMSRESVPRLRALGFDLEPLGTSAPHGRVTAGALPDLLRSLDVEHSLALRLARAVGGHHGVFPSNVEVESLRGQDRGGAPWDAARRDLFEGLRSWLLLPNLPNRPNLLGDHAFFVALAGLTSVADWIGSMESHFLFEPDARDLTIYASTSAARASAALEDVGWFRSCTNRSVRAFGDLFPGKRVWPLHQLALDVAETLPPSSLVVVEVPMGEGKTEAALTLAHNLERRHGHGGFYVALPTQATSNQMLRRVKGFLECAQPDERTNLHLLHGDAALVDDYRELRLRCVCSGAQGDDPGSDGTVVAEEWFARRKRGLLSTFAVGTVDQALLGVLHVRHGFVRLFGLAGKVVILDEVHAYDTYTSALLDRLVAWLGALGASVVILSATLPRRRLGDLVHAFGGPPTFEPSSYPRLTRVSGTSVESVPVPLRGNEPRRLGLRWVARGSVVADLACMIRGGGCVAWITNTVAAAQDAFTELRDARERGEIPVDTDIALLHARFPFGERQAIERKVLDCFGKDAGRDGKLPRPHRAVLVGTQVLEQSLDVDFDLMVTELAPVDLVLQRSGRVHRHDGRTRPKTVETPQLWIVTPEDSERPEGPVLRSVYHEHVLLRTWLFLRDRTTVTLPMDLEGLIESVYGESEDPAWAAPILERAKRTRERFVEDHRKHEHEAQVRILAAPDDDEDILGKKRPEVEEDDPAVARDFRAVTRLGGPSVDVVCLFGSDETPTLDRAGGRRAVVARAPLLDETRALLERSVSVSHRGVVHALLENCATPAAWSRSPGLRHHRVLRFGEDPVDIGRYRLQLDDALGLVISAAAQEEDE